MVITGRKQNIILTDRRTHPDAPEDTVVNIRMLKRLRREQQKQIQQKKQDKMATIVAGADFDRTEKEDMEPVRISRLHRMGRQEQKPEEKDAARHQKTARFSSGKLIKKVEGKIEKLCTDADYEGQRQDTGAQDYEGKRKIAAKGRKMISVVAVKILTELLMLAKCIISAVLNLIVVVVIAAIVVIILIVAVIRNATYDFIADEEYFIRENYSRITAELSCDISELQRSYACNLRTSGEFADPKEVIALWWTIKNNYGRDAYWDSFMSGEDKDGLEYIFYQFNHIELSGVVEGNITQDGVSVTATNQETTEDNRYLYVTITTESLEDLVEHWQLNGDQEAYLHELLADEAIWDEILGTGELSVVALQELNNSVSKYLDYYGVQENGNLYFVVFCMHQLHLISDDYIPMPANMEELQQTMLHLGFYRDEEYAAKSGDLIFLNQGGSLKCGIVSVANGDDLTVITADYNHDIVEEIYLTRSSGLIAGYAELGGFFVEALLDIRSSDVDMVATALSQVGIVNGNPYWSWYGFPNAVPWCACFVSWVANENGYIETGIIPKFADCVYGVNWFKNNNQWQDGGVTPEAGWIIFFDWPDDSGYNNRRDGRPDHVGIVSSVDGNTVYTVEGNSGNAVKEQSYQLDSPSILGYGTPQY